MDTYKNGAQDDRVLFEKIGTYDQRLVVGREVVVINCTSDIFRSESTKGGEPVFHGNNTSDCSCVIPTEDGVSMQRQHEK